MKDSRQTDDNDALQGLRTLQRLQRQKLLMPLDISQRDIHRRTPSPLLSPISRLSPSPRASYLPVIVRTYRYEQQAKPETPVRARAVPAPKAFKCSWTKLPYQEGRPQVREGASMVECCGSLYLYGGLSKSVLSDIYVLRPGSKCWETVSTTGLEPESRYGHSMEQHGASMVLFGGAINANPKTQIRECFNTVRLLRPTGETGAHWSLLRTHGCVVQMRRYHSASIVGKQMLVVGGMNQKNKVLDDCVSLDLHTGEWTLETLDSEPLAIACHTAVTVLESQFTASSLSDLQTQQPSTELKVRGIYLFGGMDGLGLCTNRLRVVQAGNGGKLRCIELEAAGKAPAARCLHSMVLSRGNNALIVFGGKSQETRLNAAAVYKDLHVLALHSLTWSPVTVSGNLPQARWAHSAGTLQDQMIVFGGIEFNLFSSSETFLLSLSSEGQLPVVVVGKTEARSKSTGRIKVKKRSYVM